MSKYVPPFMRGKGGRGNDDDNDSGFGRKRDNGYGGGFGGKPRYDPYSRNKGGSGGSRFDSDNYQPYHRDEDATEDLFKEHRNTGINFDKYDDIPVSVEGKDVPPPITDFAHADLPKPLKDNLDRANFQKPTPVQRYSIPILMKGRDLMAVAQTGSGKTGGFLFPVIADLYNANVKPEPRQNFQPATPQALVLAPTRELATQIFDECRKFSFKTGLAARVIYGGADANYQIKQISRGCNILVATPGRLTDLIGRGVISLSQIQFLVMDEADRMLDMGFEPQIREIVEGEKMPPAGERKTLMFSATFPKDIQTLAADFMGDYVYLTVGRVGRACEFIEQKFELTTEDDKIEALLKKLSEFDASTRSLVFVKRKKTANYIDSYLNQNGYSSVSIHGDRSQREREFALKHFKRGTRKILVATDVAARGIDVENIGHVINFDLPENIDDYVHRIGRTGRAGNKGTASSLFTEDDAGIAKELIKNLEENKQEVPSFLIQAARTKSASRGYKRGGNRRGGYGGGGFGNRRGGRGGFGGNSGGYGGNSYGGSSNGGSRGGFGGDRRGGFGNRRGGFNNDQRGSGGFGGSSGGFGGGFSAF